MTKIPYAMAIGNWLPYSETFIYDQVKHAKKFEPYVIARGLNPARENFPYDHVTSLGPVARMLYYAALPCGKFVNVIKESGSRFVHAHFGTNGALVSATAKKAGVPESLLTADTKEGCEEQAQAILAFARPTAYPSVPDAGEAQHFGGGGKPRDKFADWMKQMTGG